MEPTTRSPAETNKSVDYRELFGEDQFGYDYVGGNIAVDVNPAVVLPDNDRSVYFDQRIGPRLTLRVGGDLFGVYASGAAGIDLNVKRSGFYGEVCSGGYAIHPNLFKIGACLDQSPFGVSLGWVLGIGLFSTAVRRTIYHEIIVGVSVDAVGAADAFRGWLNR